MSEYEQSMAVLEAERQQNLESIIKKMVSSKFFTDAEMRDVVSEFGMTKFYLSLTGEPK